MIRQSVGRLVGKIALASVVVCLFALPAAAQGMIQGTVVDAQGQARRRRQDHDRADRGCDPQVRDEDRQEGRVHSDRTAVVRLQGHRGKRQAGHRDRQHARQPARSGERAARHRRRRGQRSRRGRQDRRTAQGVRRRRRAEPRRQVRRVDRVVQQGAGGQPQLPGLPVQHRLRIRAEEGARQGRGELQEGDPREAGLRRGLQRARQHLQRPAEIRRGGRGQREGERADGVRARRPRGRQRRLALQPGRHPLEFRQDSGCEEGVRAGDRRESRTTPSRTTSSRWRS